MCKFATFFFFKLIVPKNYVLNKNKKSMSYILVKLIIAALNAPKPIPDKIEYYKTLYSIMHENALFTTLSTKLTAFLAKTTALETVQVEFKRKFPTKSKEDRDFADREADAAAKVIVVAVQELANADLPHAADIITASGLKVIYKTVRVPQVADVVDGPTSPSNHIMGDGSGNHNFRKSLDGITWLNMLGNGTSNLSYKDVIVGRTYYYQVQKVGTKGRVGPWSRVMSITVR